MVLIKLIAQHYTYTIKWSCIT